MNEIIVVGLTYFLTGVIAVALLYGILSLAIAILRLLFPVRLPEETDTTVYTGSGRVRYSPGSQRKTGIREW